MHNQIENISDKIKKQMAALLPVTIEELGDKSFDDIEKIVNELASQHFNDQSEALWQIFWHHHATSEALPKNSNYCEAVQQFYTFWQTLKHKKTEETPNGITLAAIITAQRGCERLVPFFLRRNCH